MPAGQRDRLEHLCRYVARPAIATERLSLAAGDDPDAPLSAEQEAQRAPRGLPQSEPETHDRAEGYQKSVEKRAEDDHGATVQAAIRTRANFRTNPSVRSSIGNGPALDARLLEDQPMHALEARKVVVTAILAVALTAACASAPSGSKAIASRVSATSNARHPGHPINLARTSLAAVDASSVNGLREMDNPYYGVVNAFDDGEHWINGINYTSWMPNLEAGPYIDVQFDAPVMVTAIEAKVPSGTSLTASLEHANGDVTSLGSPKAEAPEAEIPVVPATGAHPLPSTAPFAIARFGPPTPAVTRIPLSEPELEVRSMRVHFAGGKNLEVHELRVLGFPPEGVACETRPPRISATERNAQLSGNAALERWKTALFEDLTPEVVEHDDAFVVTYMKSAGPGSSGKPICRVSVSKTTGRATMEPLVPAW